MFVVALVLINANFSWEQKTQRICLFARAELFRKVYRERKISDEMLDTWFVYFHQCSQCRRCSVFCPYGIDTAEISMAAREIMDSIGFGQKYTLEVLTKLLGIGNNLGLQKSALQNTLTFMEEEIKEESGIDVRLPLDVEGAEVLFITPSADFFASPHIESLKGYAKYFIKQAYRGQYHLMHLKQEILGYLLALMELCKKRLKE